jgi:hypothetical protein
MKIEGMPSIVKSMTIMVLLIQSKPKALMAMHKKRLQMMFALPPTANTVKFRYI